MCIDLREKSATPYNKKRIRYKVIRVTYDNVVTSPSVRSHRWKLNNWRRGKAVRSDGCNVHGYSNNAVNHGFHVYVNRRAAQQCVKDSDNESYYVGTFEVDGFIASGTNSNKHTEVWKRAKLLKVCSWRGHNRTKKLFPRAKCA